LIDKIIHRINWLEGHPTPSNFIDLRNLINHQLGRPCPGRCHAV
jgi:hypothetical protein